jgi:hypothetical protein
MKKRFLILFAISFGLSLALIASFFTMAALGPRDAAGNPVFSQRPLFAAGKRPFDLVAYERTQAAVKALLISDVKWVRQKDHLGLTFEVENVKDYALDKSVVFKAVFMQGGELKGLTTMISAVALPAKGRKLIVDTISRDIPQQFDNVHVATE